MNKLPINNKNMIRYLCAVLAEHNNLGYISRSATH